MNDVYWPVASAAVATVSAERDTITASVSPNKLCVFVVRHADTAAPPGGSRDVTTVGSEVFDHSFARTVELIVIGPRVYDRHSVILGFYSFSFLIARPDLIDETAVCVLPPSNATAAAAATAARQRGLIVGVRVCSDSIVRTCRNISFLFDVDQSLETTI